MKLVSNPDPILFTKCDCVDTDCLLRANSGRSQTAS